MEVVVESEFQNVLIDGNIDLALERAQMKADALVRESEQCKNAAGCNNDKAENVLDKFLYDTTGK